jgi:L-ascorbate metabolism protein UlaG (beta-lactamase superfamily)
MKISKYIHSCVLVEEGNTKILFDPGSFSFIEALVSPHIFTDISVICITHSHGDHVDVTALKIILANNPHAVLYTNASVRDMLAGENIFVELFESGTKQVGAFEIQAIAAEHERLLTPVPHNTAYLINTTLLHPGDSFHESLLAYAGIPVLALPLIAPWADKVRIAEFATALQPKHVIPIHDGFVKDFFREKNYKEFSIYLQSRGSTFHALKEPGAYMSV